MSPCDAAQYTNGDGNIQFELADGWAVVSRSPLLLSSPGGDMVLMCEITRAEDMESALAGSEAILMKQLSDIRPGEPQSRRINGIPASWIEGTGKAQDQDIQFKMLVLEGKRGVYTILFYFGIPDAQEANAENMRRFVTSIRRIR